ncbi:hypothetical protein CF394_11380 [Tetzosporium hominis]|uniref:Uncharacterized protein n=1 Tax=Tetzosporium hominis TaxID=2020506 RepID=A0A264W321_9BACL|nr:hypothetical protein [Tetzosporium hominis]OZS77437.1 hypothetical protein CF394_11380 [Tetzosporium hominis]
MSEKSVGIGISIILFTTVVYIEFAVYKGLMSTTLLTVFSILQYHFYTTFFLKGQKLRYFAFLALFAGTLFLCLPSMTEELAQERIKQEYGVEVVGREVVLTDASVWNIFSTQNALFYDTKTKDGEMERFFVNLENGVIVKMDEK